MPMKNQRHGLPVPGAHMPPRNPRIRRGRTAAALEAAPPPLSVIAPMPPPDPLDPHGATSARTGHAPARAPALTPSDLFRRAAYRERGEQDEPGEPGEDHRDRGHRDAAAAEH